MHRFVSRRRAGRVLAAVAAPLLVGLIAAPPAWADAPSAPAQPTVAGGNAEVTVSFVAPDDGGSAITEYDAGCTSSDGGVAGAASGSDTPIVVGALSNGNSYTCTVTATNADGTSDPSPVSAVVIPSTVPDAPAQPTVAAADSQVTVSFVAPDDGGSTITSYAAACSSSDGGVAGTANGVASPIVVGNLSNGNSYTCTVTASNASGAGATSPASVVAIPSTVPSAPAAPTVSAGNALITVTFVAPSDGGSAITNYAAACVSSNSGAPGSGNGAASPIVVGGLTIGKTYTCTVTATNANGPGPASPASATAVPNRVPDPPAAPTVVGGNAQVTVSFAAPFDGGSAITGYTAACLPSGGGSSGSVTGTASPIVVGGLSNGQSYTCKVTAANANGSGVASAASAAVVPSTVPSAPAQPTASSGNAQLSVSFVAPADGGSAITSYSASCVSSNSGTPGSATGPGSPIVVGALSNGKSYTCTVTATNANGPGSASPASAVAIPSTVPSAPAQPTVTAGNAQVTVTFAAPADGGSAITNYSATCVSANGGATGSASGATSPIVVGTLSNGKSYTCTVTATNANGPGAASPASAAVIPSTVPSAPAAPTLGAGNGQLTVAFTAPADGGSAITSYAVSCPSSNGGTTGQASGAASPIVVSALTNGKSYTCTVTATNANGPGAASPASAAAVPNTVPSAPAAPTVSAGNAQITVTFAAPADGGSAITGYSAACASSNLGVAGSANGTASPIVVSGLTNGKSYTCTVTASNANGAGAASAASAVAIPSTVPSTPAAPTAASGNGQLTVSFAAPADGGSAITSYAVSCVSSNGGTAGQATGAASPIVVTLLSNGNSYTCTVTATNANGAGGTSAASAVAIPSTVPSAPAAPTVVAANAQITVTFAAPANGGSAITNYGATCTSSGSGATGTLSGAGSPIVVGGLTNGQSYTCKVTATNANGAGAASAASAAVIPSTVPSTPTAPTVGAGNGQVTVVFVAPFDGGRAITSYSVLCVSSNGGTAGVPTAGAASPIVVTGLTNGKSYTCTLTATNENGTSAASPASAVVIPNRVPDPPAQPTVVAANAQITVSFAVPFDGGSPITGYTAACTSSNLGVAGSANGTVSPIVVSGLTNGKSYTCTVTATNANGTGAGSTASATAIPNTVPSAPAAPTVVAGNAQVTVTFVAPFDGGSAITSYTAACAPSGAGASGSITGAASPIVVTGLTNGSSYTCKVTATNANGPGAASAASAAVTPSTVPSAPAVPTVVAANAQVTVAFVAPNNGGSAIISYTAACAPSGTGTSGAITGPASPIVVGGLTNGLSYTCKVTATNANGPGAASAASAAVIPSTVPSAPAAPTVAVGNGAVTVTFVAPNNGGNTITRYDATCVSSNGGVTGSDFTASSPILVAPLSNGKTYTCTVTATNANGTGPASPASATVVPSTVPTAPGQPTAGVGNGQLTVAFAAPFDGGNPISSYSAACASSNGGAAGAASGAASPILVTGLTNGKSYTCTVTATNSNGSSGPSVPSSVAVPNRVPDAPAAPTVASANTQVTVSFVAPFNGGSAITGFGAACVSANGGAAGSATGPSSSTSIVVTGLTNGKSYTCTVTATNANGTGVPSPASAVAIPSTIPAAPAKPKVVAGNALVTVSFAAPANGGSAITSYTATCSSSNGGKSMSKTGARSPLKVTGVTNDKSYRCFVTAHNANGDGHRSNSSSIALPVDPISVASRTGHGFRLFAGDGGVFTFGDAVNYGSAAGVTRNLVVGMASTPGNHGYWLVATDGGIFSFGNARFYGSTGAIHLNRPIVGMAATPSGKGYWLVASDGGIFSFGDARFYGSTGAIRLNQPIVGMASTATGHGYWLVASDGGLFSFGDAHFHGSAAGVTHSKVAGMATAAGGGYWIAAADGSVYNFGGAPALGRAPASQLRLPVRGIQSTASGKGYWLAAGDGGLFAFGDAPYISWPGPLVLSATIQGVSR